MRSNRTKLLPRGMVAGRTGMSPAEQNVIDMADALFAALTKPRVIHCVNHAQPTFPGSDKCRHCGLDAAEQILIHAASQHDIRHGWKLVSSVLSRAQMWVNVARYSDEDQRKLEGYERGSTMANLWPLLAD